MQVSLLVTQEGKHPSSKWAELAADELISIGSQSPEALIREATVLKDVAKGIFARHIDIMTNFEQSMIAQGRHDMDLPYESEAQAKMCVADICAAAANTSFGRFFARDEIQEKIEAVCNSYFKSAMLVERSHFHSSQA